MPEKISILEASNEEALKNLLACRVSTYSFQVQRSTTVFSAAAPRWDATWNTSVATQAAPSITDAPYTVMREPRESQGSGSGT